MNATRLWRGLVRSTQSLDIIRHGLAALVCAPLLPVTLYFSFAPMEAPAERLHALRGTIEKAQPAMCMEEGRKSFLAPRGCIDGVGLSVRQTNGLVQIVRFREPKDPPFDAARYPTGATLDALVPRDEIDTAYHLQPEAVAVNGVEIIPFEDNRLKERLLIVLFSLLLAILPVTFIARLRLEAMARKAGGSVRDA